MNSSVKITAISLFAVSALGAVGFACTVGGGTVDDTNGGSSTSSSSSTGGAVNDAGTDTGIDDPTGSCPQYTGGVIIENNDCQNCLLANCCESLSGCWNTKAETGRLDCGGYEDCLEKDCDDSDPDPDACKKNICRTATFPEIPAAYNNYLECLTNKCTDKCPSIHADGGSAPL